MATADATRADGRSDDELRPVRLTRGFQRHPAGSVLVEFGETRVLCAASVPTAVVTRSRDAVFAAVRVAVRVCVRPVAA